LLEKEIAGELRRHQIRGIKAKKEETGKSKSIVLRVERQSGERTLVAEHCARKRRVHAFNKGGKNRRKDGGGVTMDPLSGEMKGVGSEKESGAFRR